MPSYPRARDYSMSGPRFRRGRYFGLARTRVFTRFQKKRFREKVRDVINDRAENKYNEFYHDTNISDPAVNLTKTVVTYQLTDIPVGDTKFARDGYEIYSRSVGGRWFFEWNPSGPLCQHIRVVLYRPKNIDSLATSFTYKSVIPSEEFEIFFDKFITVTQEDPCYIMKFGKKFYSNKIGGRVTKYASTTAGDLIENAIVLAMVSSENTNPPTYEGVVRLNFKDK